jgi:hypothetical protein
MSIILEGKVNINRHHIVNGSSSTSSLESKKSWDGLWKFAKDKKSFLNFSYEVIYMSIFITR